MRFIGPASAALLAVLLIPRVLLAAEPDFQHDPVEQHTARILTVVLVLAILLVLFCIFRVWRGRTSGLFAKALLVVAVLLLPMLSVSTGMMLVLVRAERVEFCGSCHVIMGDYVADMTDPGSDGLAAIHYRNQYIPSNQCYECHSSYGLFGTVKAKVNGIQEVLRYYSDTYELPLSMSEPYRNGDCLKCHGKSAKWLAVDLHLEDEVKERLYSDEVSCMRCHGKQQPAHRIEGS